MSNQPQGLSILRTLQADNMLQGYPILDQLKGIRNLMVYRDLSFADYFDKIQTDIGTLGHLQLQADVDPMSASSYLVDLTMGYERILDDINRVTVEAQAFLGRIKTLHARATNLRKPFLVLWAIGASELVKNVTSWKVSATDMKDIATLEFSLLTSEADLELAAMVEAMDLTLDNLKSMRKLAGDKYAMGKDQVNVALSALDFEDHGIGDTPRSHKPASTEQGTMAGMFGDRFKPQPQPATATPPPALAPGEDDFPHPSADLDELDEPPVAPLVPLVPLAHNLPPNGGVASEGEEEHFQEVERRQEAERRQEGERRHERIMSAGQETPAEVRTGHVPGLEAALAVEDAGLVALSHTMSEHPGQENLGPVDLTAPPCISPELPVATPTGFVPAKDLQVGDKVLALGTEGKVETQVVTNTGDLPVLEKPGKGKAVVIPYHMHVAAPGHVPNVPGLLFGLGKTKLSLTAQHNPEENGVYRWHGVDAPLTRLEEAKAEATPVEKLVPPDEHKLVAAPPEAAPVVREEPPVKAPDAKALIQGDTFLSQAQKETITASLGEGDVPPTGLALDDDDFPMSVPETPAPQADDDDDFPVGAEIIDRTPKADDAPTPILEEKAPETPVLEVEPEVLVKPGVVAVTPDPVLVKVGDTVQPGAVAIHADAARSQPQPQPVGDTAPKPGGLFRSRVLPPNQTAAPAFRPPKTLEGVEVSSAGLDDVL